MKQDENTQDSIIQAIDNMNFDCEDCVHYQGDLICKAFPEGIPTPLFWSEVRHTKPYEGDHGMCSAEPLPVTY